MCRCLIEASVIWCQGWATLQIRLQIQIAAGSAGKSSWICREEQLDLQGRAAGSAGKSNSSGAFVVTTVGAVCHVQKPHWVHVEIECEARLGFLSEPI